MNVTPRPCHRGPAIKWSITPVYSEGDNPYGELLEDICLGKIHFIHLSQIYCWWKKKSFHCVLGYKLSRARRAKANSVFARLSWPCRLREEFSWRRFLENKTQLRGRVMWIAVICKGLKCILSHWGDPSALWQPTCFQNIKLYCLSFYFLPSSRPPVPPVLLLLYLMSLSAPATWNKVVSDCGERAWLKLQLHSLSSQNTNRAIDYNQKEAPKNTPQLHQLVK